MAQISKKELKRQLFHAIFGVTIVILLFANILNKISLFLLVVAAVVICIVSQKTKIPGIYWFLDKFEREEDLIKSPGKGALYYLISSFIVVLLFPKDIAMASILILALGDSASHVIGRLGSVKHPFTDRKFLEGFIAGVIIAFIASYIILNNALEAGFGSFIAMVIESMDIKFKKKKIDDNLLIPMVAGFIMFVVRFVIGIL